MKKNKIKKMPLLIIFILIVIGIIFFFPWKKETKKESTMKDLSQMTEEKIKAYAEENKLDLTIKKENHKTKEKGKIISQNIKPGEAITENQKLEVVISKGPIDKTVYQENKVDESGSVPIMMYHGIVHMKNDETSYTGGNVDKDGYTRTSEAFQKDLEFYYENNYYPIRLKDYIDGNIDVPLGKSPIIFTFDDGKANNIKVTGLDSNGDIIIDENSAVGIMEAFKKEHPDTNMTATFFVNGGLFEQPEYNEKILTWLVEHGYDIGNHSQTHANFTQISEKKAIEEIGKIYETLNKLLKNKYVNIVALPFGTPYNKEHANFKHIMEGTYNNIPYKTEASLRVGWESDYSPFHKNFDPHFLKRIRAYDNNGVEFDIAMNFKLLEKKRYISDGDKNTIVVPENKKTELKDTKLEVITY